MVRQKEQFGSCLIIPIFIRNEFVGSILGRNRYSDYVCPFLLFSSKQLIKIVIMYCSLIEGEKAKVG